MRVTPATDTIKHQVWQATHTEPRVVVSQLYTEEDDDFQQEIILNMVEVDIITQCNSPWATRGEVSKEEGKSAQNNTSLLP